MAKHLKTDGPRDTWVTSLKTDVFSPDLTGWRGTTTAVRVDAKGRERYRGDGGWIDESFSPQRGKTLLARRRQQGWEVLERLNGRASRCICKGVIPKPWHACMGLTPR